MKITTRLVTDWDGNVLEEESHDYTGPVAHASGGGSAPSADPNVGLAALQQAQLGQDYLSWAQNTYAQQQPALEQAQSLSNQLSQAQLAATNQQNTQAASLWDRYNSVYAPIQDKYASDVSNYGSTANQNTAASEALADVNSQYGTQTAALNRNMARMGINPSSGSYQTNNLIASNAQALAGATAQTSARQNVRNTGLALEGNAAQLGNSILTGANQTTSTGSQAATASQGISSSGTAQQTAADQIVGQGFQSAINAEGQSGSLLNSQYQNQLSAWNAGNQSSAGLWAGVGTIATAAAMAY